MAALGRTGHFSKPALLCGLCYAVLFLSLASVLRGHFGFPLDDSWIHQVMARNLVVCHKLGFIPGKATSGSTSPLWSVILATGLILLPKVSPVLVCAFIGAFLLGAIGYALKRISEDDGMPATESWCVALAPALSGNFLWYGLIGMEHLLFIFLSVALILIWSRRPEDRGRSDRVLLFLLAFLIVPTRPEGVVLVSLLLLTCVVFRRSFRDDCFAGAGGLAGLFLTLGVNWMTSGRLVPATMAGRHLLAGNRSAYLMQGVFQLARTWNYMELGEISRNHRQLAAISVLFVAGLVLAPGVWRLIALKAYRFLLLCLWGGTIGAVYLVKLPTPGHGGRYIAVLLMVCFSLILLGTSRAVGLIAGRGRACQAGVAAVAVVWVCVSVPIWRVVAAADIDQINSEHGEMARWAADNLPPGSFANLHVAVFDIGRIGYEVNGNLVDLGGLVDGGLVVYISEHRTGQYLREHGVVYVILPGKARGDDTLFANLTSLEPQYGVKLRFLHGVCADPMSARIGMLTSSTAYPCQYAYRITYLDRE